VPSNVRTLANNAVIAETTTLGTREVPRAR
jgi:hypothetical protein